MLPWRHGIPPAALRLYESRAFVPNGRVPDACRVYGQPLTDLSMALALGDR